MWLFFSFILSASLVEITLAFQFQPDTIKANQPHWTRQHSSTSRFQKISIAYNRRGSSAYPGVKQSAISINEATFQQEQSANAYFKSIEFIHDSSVANGEVIQGVEPNAPEVKGFIKYLFLAPLLISLTGFFAFEFLASSFNAFLTLLGNFLGIPVVMAQWQSSALVNAINGIIIPCVSITFATLVSSTLTVLLQRQDTLKRCLNREACILKSLLSTLKHVFLTSPKGLALHQIDVLLLLKAYCQRLRSECDPSYDKSMRRWWASVSETQSILRYVYTMELSGANNGRVSNVVQTLGQLDDIRSERLSALTTTFPALHYGVIILMGLAVLVCFLLEADRYTRPFADLIQLRLLFSFLLAAFSSTAILLYDLSKPFKFGYFCVSANGCIDQMEYLGSDIQALIHTINEENEHIDNYGRR